MAVQLCTVLCAAQNRARLLLLRKATSELKGICLGQDSDLETDPGMSCPRCSFQMLPLAQTHCKALIPNFSIGRFFWRPELQPVTPREIAEASSVQH